MKTQRMLALIAGLALIIMTVVAVLTYGYLHSTLVVPGITDTTITSLKTYNSLLISEILGWQLILVLDIIVAWSLYQFFKNENRKLSAITAGFRIVFVGIFGMAIFNFFPILKIIDGNSGSSSELMNQSILSHLNSFENTWSVALILFGFHLLFLGVLALKSKSINRIWGISLVFAAICYILINSLHQILPGYESQIKTAEMILSLPMAFGEVGFAFWLVFRGGKNQVLYRRNGIVPELEERSNELENKPVRLS